MRCPFCKQDKDKVVDSRSGEGGRIIRRRRECLVCRKRFTTYERVEAAIKLTVVKKDGSRVPYDREKIIVGVRKACYKREIPVRMIEEFRISPLYGPTYPMISLASSSAVSAIDMKSRLIFRRIS